MFRNCEAVTCVDCSVTFYGNDYEQHTSCVSEAQKYEGALYKAKKAKLNPQDAWVALIEEVSANAKEAPVALQQHLVRLGELNNVPRNKKKFVNFCTNSLKLYNEKLLESLFDYLEQKRTAATGKEEPPTAQPVVAAAAKVVEATPVVEDSEEVSKEKKSKKEKKDKKDKREKDEDIVEETPAVEEAAAVEEGSKKKKSKKEKKDRADPAVEAEEGAEDNDKETEREKKKKSKKRKHESSDE